MNFGMITLNQNTKNYAKLCYMNNESLTIQIKTF